MSRPHPPPPDRRDPPLYRLSGPGRPAPERKADTGLGKRALPDAAPVLRRFFAVLERRLGLRPGDGDGPRP